MTRDAGSDVLLAPDVVVVSREATVADDGGGSCFSRACRRGEGQQDTDSQRHEPHYDSTIDRDLRFPGPAPVVTGHLDQAVSPGPERAGLGFWSGDTGRGVVGRPAGSSRAADGVIARCAPSRLGGRWRPAARDPVEGADR